MYGIEDFLLPEKNGEIFLTQSYEQNPFLEATNTYSYSFGQNI